MVDCLAVSCLTKGEAEPDKASGGAEDDAEMHNDEADDAELDGEIVADVGETVDGSETELGAPGIEEAAVVDGTEAMDPCEDGKVWVLEEGAWWL